MQRSGVVNVRETGMSDEGCPDGAVGEYAKENDRSSPSGGAPRWVYLRVEPAALSEEGTGDEPETVADSKLVLYHVALGQTRMRIVPLVRAEACHHEEGEAH